MPILLEKEIPARQFSDFLHLNPSYFIRVEKKRWPGTHHDLARSSGVLDVL